jgi:chromosomal replication initiator protein
MRKAQDVAGAKQSGGTEAECRLVSRVEAALGQRLGKERMSLWFGPSVRWTTTEDQKVRVEVLSSFFADCIQRMFRKDLLAAVAEGVGEGWGFEVVVASGNSKANSEGSVRKPDQIIYDKDRGANASVLSPSKPEQIPPVSVVPLRDNSFLDPAPAESPIAEMHDAVANDAVANDAVANDLGSDLTQVDPQQATDIEPVSNTPAFNVTTQLPSPPALRLVREESDTTTRNPINTSLLDAADQEIARLVALRRSQERRWEDWIVGNHNRFATTGAEMVLEKPGRVSPLLIHGPHGVGKSHLAVGLAHRLKTMYRYRRVVCLTGEQFTIEYTESARSGGFASFRKKYRDVEVLVIDDVQFLLGKTGTLIELRNTIDMLMRDQRQIILVADRGLHELAGMGTDLFARLSGGMACAIDPMDSSTRRTLLARLCEQQATHVDAEVLDWVAEHCGSDARVLQGIVHRLAAQQRICGGKLTSDDAIRSISDIVRANQPIVRLRDIEKVVCEAFGLEDDVLRAKSKCQSFSQPRMLAMFLARKYTRTALSEIGAYFGNRQHSTVISAHKKVETWLDANEVLQMGRTHVPVQEILRSLEVTLQVG